MKAWVLSDIGDFSLKEVKDPKPADNEVIVKVKNCGICGSDIPRAFRDGAHNMPLIIGHEFAGSVIECGKNVSEKWKGKKVGIFPLIPCMKCPSCMNRQYEMCSKYNYLGSRCNGGFAEYVAVPEWNLIELSDNISFEQAAMLEPMSVALHAIRKSGIDMDTKSVAIFGAGTIGLFILMHILSMGIENVYIIGNHDIQKKKAAELGLNPDNFIDTRISDPVRLLMDHTCGLGVSATFEVVGTESVYEEAVSCTGATGRICLVGNPHSDMGLSRNIYWKILRSQLTLCGTWNSSFKGYEDDWRDVIKSLDKGLIKPETLITHRFTLVDIDRGFHIMRDKSEDYIKIMCECT
ncbi:MAG: galactitol-1-phosphate 5-dehydrogenase [Lachnospiraceae bacterium]|nr:galactitol-1-phosphate 5-dehydrogenase [Lachnospiraceae bacterium]